MNEINDKLPRCWNGEEKPYLFRYVVLDIRLFHKNWQATSVKVGRGVN